MQNEPLGLLAQGNPLLDLGVGLLAASGPQRHKVGLGQALASGAQYASGRQQQRTQNEFLRQKLSLQNQHAKAQAEALAYEQAQRQRKSEALKKLQGLLGSENPDQGQVIGLLGEVAPQQLVTGLLGNMFPQSTKPPAIVSSLIAAGIDPASEEGRQIITQSLTADSRGVDAATDQVRLLQAQLELQNAQRQQTQVQEEQTETEATEGKLINDNLASLENLVKYNEELNEIGGLASTSLPGVGSRRDLTSILAAGKEIVGMDATKNKKAVELVDSFNKEAARLASIRGGGTDTERETIRQSLPSPELEYGANKQVIASEIKSYLEQADIQGVKVKDREKYEKLLKDLTQQSTDYSKIPGWDKLTKEEQQELIEGLQGGN